MYFILLITTFYLHQESLHSDKYYQRYSTFYNFNIVALFHTRACKRTCKSRLARSHL